MNFAAGFTQFKNIMGIFVNAQSGNSAPQPLALVWVRYVARMAILGLVLFIFAWWPVDSFDTLGFDTWSARMAVLPDKVWYVILGVILSWGTTEVMAARSYNPRQPDYTMDASPSGITGPRPSGRFAVAHDDDGDDDDFFTQPASANSVIDEWRTNAPK